MSGSAARDAIRNALALHAQLVDDGRFDEWSELYAHDGEFVAAGKVWKGRAAIRELGVSSLPPTLRRKHLLSEPWIELGGSTARASTDFFRLEWSDERGFAVTSAGRYVDVLTRHADRWLLSRREIVFLEDRHR